MLSLTFNPSNDVSIKLYKDTNNYVVIITEGAFNITLPLFNNTIESIKYWLGNTDYLNPLEDVLYKNYLLHLSYIEHIDLFTILITYIIKDKRMQFKFEVPLNEFKAWIDLLTIYVNKT